VEEGESQFVGLEHSPNGEMRELLHGMGICILLHKNSVGIPIGIARRNITLQLRDLRLTEKQEIIGEYPTKYRYFDA
jgi:hypothetical protein